MAPRPQQLLTFWVLLLTHAARAFQFGTNYYVAKGGRGPSSSSLLWVMKKKGNNSNNKLDNNFKVDEIDVIYFQEKRVRKRQGTKVPDVYFVNEVNGSSENVMVKNDGDCKVEAEMKRLNDAARADEIMKLKSVKNEDDCKVEAEMKRLNDATRADEIMRKTYLKNEDDCKVEAETKRLDDATRADKIMKQKTLETEAKRLDDSARVGEIMKQKEEQEARLGELEDIILAGGAWDGQTSLFTFTPSEPSDSEIEARAVATRMGMMELRLSYIKTALKMIPEIVTAEAMKKNEMVDEETSVFKNELKRTDARNSYSSLEQPSTPTSYSSLKPSTTGNFENMSSNSSAISSKPESNGRGSSPSSYEDYLKSKVSVEEPVPAANTTSSSIDEAEIKNLDPIGFTRTNDSSTSFYEDYLKSKAPAQDPVSNSTSDSLANPSTNSTSATGSSDKDSDSIASTRTGDTSSSFYEDYLKSKARTPTIASEIVTKASPDSSLNQTTSYESKVLEAEVLDKVGYRDEEKIENNVYSAKVGGNELKKVIDRNETLSQPNRNRLTDSVEYSLNRKVSKLTNTTKTAQVSSVSTSYSSLKPVSSSASQTKNTTDVTSVQSFRGALNDAPQGKSEEDYFKAIKKVKKKKTIPNSITSSPSTSQPTIRSTRFDFGVTAFVGAGLIFGSLFVFDNRQTIGDSVDYLSKVQVQTVERRVFTSPKNSKDYQELELKTRQVQELKAQNEYVDQYIVQVKALLEDEAKRGAELAKRANIESQELKVKLDASEKVLNEARLQLEVDMKEKENVAAGEDTLRLKVEVSKKALDDAREKLDAKTMANIDAMKKAREEEDRVTIKIKNAEISLKEVRENFESEVKANAEAASKAAMEMKGLQEELDNIANGASTIDGDSVGTKRPFQSPAQRKQEEAGMKVKAEALKKMKDEAEKVKLTGETTVEALGKKKAQLEADLISDTDALNKIKSKIEAMKVEAKSSEKALSDTILKLKDDVNVNVEALGRTKEEVGLIRDKAELAVKYSHDSVAKLEADFKSINDTYLSSKLKADKLKAEAAAAEKSLQELNSP